KIAPPRTCKTRKKNLFFFCFLNCLTLISVTYDIVSHSALDKLAYLLIHFIQHTRHIGSKVSKIKILLPNGSKKGPNKIQRSHHQMGPKGPFKNKDRTTKRVQKDQIKIKYRTTKRVQKDHSKYKDHTTKRVQKDHSKFKDRTTKRVQRDHSKIKIAPPNGSKRTKENEKIEHQE